MVSEEVEMKLYNAASQGDVTTLVHLLEEHPYLVHGVSFPCSRNLLHIAAMHGQTSIVEQVLNLNQELVRISDSQKSSPLHIAAARGHVEIASKLLAVAPEMCWWRDDQGMNPVHVAAMHGHVEILELLLLENFMPAMEILHRGQTVLHLCVKHAQLRVLKVLLEKLGGLVCAKDDDGNTLLHLAVRCHQLEIVEYLVEIKVLKQETRNGMGKTAVQILNESPPTTINYLEMKRLLIDQSDLSLFEVYPDMSSTVMVVLVLIATMAFQSAISPSGGVWDADGNYANSTHKAGEAVMASTHPVTYMSIKCTNTTAFLCSFMSATYLLIYRIRPTYKIILLWSWAAMGAALMAIVLTFLLSMDAITPHDLKQSTGNTITSVVVVMWGILSLITACNFVVRDLYRLWLNEKRRQLDLSADAFPLRVFYWIFQQLETHGILRAVR